MSSTFTGITPAEKLDSGSKRLFVGAYGFEQRAMGWMDSQQGGTDILNRAVLLHYVNTSKGRNRRQAFRRGLETLGASNFTDVRYDVGDPYNIEASLSSTFDHELRHVEEVIVDVSAMTKLAILVTLCRLRTFDGRLRIVYTEANDYAPTKLEYDDSKSHMETIAKFPSQGVKSIIRMRCLSSIRMQGQPVSLIAFASFNEQLVRHMLGTISPHRLFLINGRPPSEDFAWRERATQEIHGRLMNEYSSDNPVDAAGLLQRNISTLQYRETIACIDEIYSQVALHERIICAATGSKMQTVGLFFAKEKHPDIHIEYPTPDSYFTARMSTGIKRVHEINILSFASFLNRLRDEEASVS